VIRRARVDRSETHPCDVPRADARSGRGLSFGGGVGGGAQLLRPLDSELLHTQFNVQQVFHRPPVPQCGVVLARVEGTGRVVGAVAGTGARSSVPFAGAAFTLMRRNLQRSLAGVQPNFLAAAQVCDTAMQKSRIVRLGFGTS
jgi:hypothetical protein